MSAFLWALVSTSATTVSSVSSPQSEVTYPKPRPVEKDFYQSSARRKAFSVGPVEFVLAQQATQFIYIPVDGCVKVQVYAIHSLVAICPA